MSTYQIYDFKKDIDYHIDKQIIIDLKTKSQIFKTFLFKLKHFQFADKIKESHPVFNEKYFIFTMYSKVYVAKRIDENFKSIEILNGLRIIRKIKLQNIFKNK